MQLTLVELGANKGFALQVRGKTPVQVFKKLKHFTSKKNQQQQQQQGSSSMVPAKRQARG